MNETKTNRCKHYEWNGKDCDCGVCNFCNGLRPCTSCIFYHECSEEYALYKGWEEDEH